MKWYGADDPFVSERFIIAAFYHPGENFLFCHYYPNWMEMKRDVSGSTSCKLVSWTCVENLNKSAIETDFVRGEILMALRTYDIKELRDYVM